MNRIGVSCPDFGKRPFAECLAEISKSFAHWEIFSELEHAVQGISGTFKDAVEPYGMTFSIHSAIADTDMAACNERMREASVMEIMSEMESAYDMGVDLITVHPGLINLAVSGVRERSVAKAKETMRVLDRASVEYGVGLAIENMPRVPVMLGVTAEELADIVDGTNLGICFDIGHANTSGQIDAMIETFRDRIANVHIHDNNGERDEHLTLGEGNIDFLSVIRKMPFYKGRYIIESKSLESAVESQKTLREYLA